MVFSRIGFPRKYWCTMHCVDVFVIVYYALMNVKAYDIVSVGIGVDPGFNSKSTPTSPKYWCFR